MNQREFDQVWEQAQFLSPYEISFKQSRASRESVGYFGKCDGSPAYRSALKRFVEMRQSIENKWRKRFSQPTEPTSTPSSEKKVYVSCDCERCGYRNRSIPSTCRFYWCNQCGTRGEVARDRTDSPAAQDINENGKPPFA